jgi:hypothetical protein
MTEPPAAPELLLLATDTGAVATGFDDTVFALLALVVVVTGVVVAGVVLEVTVVAMTLTFYPSP